MPPPEPVKCSNTEDAWEMKIILPAPVHASNSVLDT